MFLQSSMKGGKGEAELWLHYFFSSKGRSLHPEYSFTRNGVPPIRVVGRLGSTIFFVPTHPNFTDITNSQAGGKENGWTDRWIEEKKKKREKDGRKGVEQKSEKREG